MLHELVLACVITITLPVFAATELPLLWYQQPAKQWVEALAADMARIAADPVTQHWWAKCVPRLDPLRDRAPGKIWSPLAEVFHLG